MVGCRPDIAMDTILFMKGVLKSPRRLDELFILSFSPALPGRLVANLEFITLC
jgi:hypothetical protein